MSKMTDEKVPVTAGPFLTSLCLSLSVLWCPPRSYLRGWAGACAASVSGAIGATRGQASSLLQDWWCLPCTSGLDVAELQMQMPVIGVHLFPGMVVLRAPSTVGET